MPPRLDSPMQICRTLWTCLACGRHEESTAVPPSCICGVEQSWLAPEEDLITRRSPGSVRAVLASSMAAVDLPRVATGESELDELLGGGFATGSAVLAYGRHGSGKSRLTYRWGSRDPCLIVCPELSLDVARAIVASAGGQLSTAYLLQSLEGWQQEAERLGVRSLVLDSLGAAHRPVPLLRAAQEWARKGGGVAYCIQHANKKGDHRGETSLAHWADYELRIAKPTPTSSSTRVELRKTRLGPTGMVALKLI
jgi:predicted ATP-dependent serine protease